MFCENYARAGIYSDGKPLIIANLITKTVPEIMPLNTDGIDNIDSGWVLSPGSRLITTNPFEIYVMNDTFTWDEIGFDIEGDYSYNLVADLKTTGYTAGSTSIENLADASRPFTATCLSGTLSDQVSQSDKGIRLNTKARVYIASDRLVRAPWKFETSIYFENIVLSVRYGRIICPQPYDLMEINYDKELNASYIYIPSTWGYLPEILAENVERATSSIDRSCLIARDFNSDFWNGHTHKITYENDGDYITLSVDDTPIARLDTGIIEHIMLNSSGTSYTIKNMGVGDYDTYSTANCPDVHVVSMKLYELVKNAS